VQDKQHQKTFSKDEALNANKLGLLHTNVWGLAKTPSFGATRYFVFFTDDFFHKSFYLHFEEQRKVFFKIQRFSSLHQKPNWRKNQDSKERQRKRIRI
jgi:hypothetical protein